MNNRSQQKDKNIKGSSIKTIDESTDDKPERIAKRMARAGLCSRREAETWIMAGRVALNGKVLESPAITVTVNDKIEVDGKLLAGKERTRLWLFHKPSGTVTTNRDPEGRKTIFEVLPEGLPRLVSVGRLDINTEGLLLLTNDGGLSRELELPATGWLRRYRARVHGTIKQETLDTLRDGIAVDGVLYGAIEAEIEKVSGSNSWLSVGLREGKNREIKKVMAALGLEVTRLIRISFGPFQLSDLPVGGIREIRSRTLRDQLGQGLIERAGADFEAPIINQVPEVTRSAKKAAAQTEKPVRKQKHKKGTVRSETLARLTTAPGKKKDGKHKSSNARSMHKKQGRK